MALELNIPDNVRALAGGLIGAIVVIAASVFGGSKWMSYQKTLVEELDGLTSQITDHDQAMKSKPRLEGEYNDLRDEILDKWDSMKILNPLSGTRIYLENARAIINTIGAESGVVISNIEPHGEAEVPGKNDKFSFQTYSVRLTMAGGYENIRYLIDKLKKNNPYIIISEFGITRSNDPLNNGAWVVVRWPIFRDIQEKEDWIIELRKSLEEDAAPADSGDAESTPDSGDKAGDNA